MSTETLTLLAAVTGALSALATFLTVWEMRRQRQSAYKPDVLVRQSEFKVFAPHPAGQARYILTTEGSLLLADATPWSAFVDLYNAGFGPARHVQIRWRFDVDRLGALLNGQLPAGSVRIERASSGFLMVQGFGGHAGHHPERQAERHVLVIPSQETERVPLPPVYVDLLARYAGALSAGSSQSPGEIELPPIELSVQYEDLENASRSVDVTIQPELLMVATQGDGPSSSLTIAHGYFAVRDA